MKDIYVAPSSWGRMVYESPVSVSSILSRSASDLGGILFRRSIQMGAWGPTALASSLAFLLIAFLASPSACS